MESISSVIAVTGLAFEARIAGGVAVISDGLRIPGILGAAIGRGTRGIISFGVCGGLAPDLAPGQWVVASSVVSGDERHLTDERWSHRLLAALPEAKHVVFAGFNTPLGDAQERGRLHAHTGAAVADMESHVAARIATAHNLPFTACRVVLNPAHRRLPPAALLNLRPGGTPDLKAILRSVIDQPRQLRDLTRLAIDASIAISALRRGKPLLGPNFAFSDPVEHNYHDPTSIAEAHA